MRIVDDRYAAVEQLRAERFQQEACFAGNGRPADPAEQMPDKRTANARVKDHGHLSAFDGAGVQPLDGAFTGTRADTGGAGEIGKMPGRTPVIIAFFRVAIT